MTDMLDSRFFTKPMQGGLFVQKKEKKLNLSTSTSTNVHRSVLED